jgi:hypothetical protein
VVSTFPSAVTLINSTVLAPGMAFSAITNGSCVDPLTFSIRDAIGLQTTATLTNTLGEGAPPTAPPPALDVNPASQTVASCTGKTVSELITGGTPPYGVSAQTVNSHTPIVTNSDGSPLPLAAPGYVKISGMFTGDGTYNFIVSDSSSPQQTTSFKITCP